MTNITLTIDYEVFLGKHEFPEDTKNKLMIIVDKLRYVVNTKLLIFIDFNFFRQIEGEKIYQLMFDEFFRDIRNKNNNIEIGFHYHPHWWGGVNIGNNTVESISNYPYTYDENILNEPKQFLELLSWARKKVEPFGFHLTAYRAGGWKYPQQDDFSHILWVNGLKTDYSNNGAGKALQSESIHYITVTQLYRPIYNLQRIAQYARKRMNILLSEEKELMAKTHRGIEHRTMREKISNRMRIYVPADIDTVTIKKSELINKKCILVCHPKNFNEVTEKNLNTIRDVQR